jgi:RimJ/RimL family protein N-acetyltransferase
MILPAERLALDTSDDLYLSRITAEDAIDIRTYMNDNPSVMRSAPEGTQISEWRAGAMIDRHLYDIQTGLAAPYLVRQADARVVGYARLEYRAPWAEAEYSIAEDMRGRGIAALVMQRLIEQGQAQHGLERIGFYITADNRASQAVAGKLGARYRHNEGSPSDDHVILQYWEKAL